VELFGCLRASSTRIFAIRVLVLVAILCASIQRTAQSGQDITLEWFPSPSPLAAGYAVYYGSTSGSYDSRFDAGTNTTATITNLSDGLTYYFVVATYDGNDNESIPSNEVSYSMPYTPPAFSSIELQNGQVVMTWDAVPGRTYQIQFKTTLNQTDWQPLGDAVTTIDSSASFSDSPGLDDQRFYRLVTIPDLPSPSPPASTHLDSAQSWKYPPSNTFQPR
jgi:hypothetical protein